MAKCNTNAANTATMPKYTPPAEKVSSPTS